MPTQRPRGPERGAQFALTSEEQYFLGLVHAGFCLRELTVREGDAYSASARSRGIADWRGAVVGTVWDARQGLTHRPV